MAEVVVFHHVQGLTDGVHAFADELRADGHTVHTPDMFGGRTFPTIDDGIAFAQEQGFGKLVAGGVAAADDLPADVVYVGFSFGAMPAQQLAQTKPGARGALLIYGVVPYTEFGDAWPDGRPGADPRDGERRVVPRGPAVRRRRSRPRPTSPSCSSTPATSTSSPTPRRPTTTPMRPRC